VHIDIGDKVDVLKVGSEVDAIVELIPGVLLGGITIIVDISSIQTPTSPCHIVSTHVTVVA